MIKVWHDKNWFVIQSKHHQENLAAAVVAKLEIESFLPKIRTEQAVAGVPRRVDKPLFPGYLFARFSPMVSLEPVRRSFGVLRVVGTRDHPIPLDEQVINRIRERISDSGYIEPEGAEFQQGETVAIARGPFSGWMGKVEREWDDGKRVSILLELMDHARVLVEKQWLTSC